jgi:hypothetical protein
MLNTGEQFPNFFLNRPDGTHLELYDLRKKEHALLLFIETPNQNIMALVQRFQDEMKLFDWLKTRMIAVFQDVKKIPTPWPAPMYSPFVYQQALPKDIQWGQGYLVSRNRTLYSIYPELDFLSAHQVEQDVLHWEAGHCLG